MGTSAESKKITNCDKMDSINLEDCITDNYQHSSSDSFYIVTRTSGPGAPEELLEEFTEGCKCSTICHGSTCPCLKEDASYVLENGRLVLKPGKLKPSGNPVIECHAHCTCFREARDKMPNETARRSLANNEILRCRYVQFGPKKSLEVVTTRSKGFGLTSNTTIYKGEYICEYAGEVISEEEGQRRRQINQSLGLMNYVFTLYEHVAEKQIITCVDPAVFGNIGKYINHSCSPNAAVVPVRVSSVVPLLCVFAIENISAGQEICFDYGGGDPSASNITCACGSPVCRGYLPGGGV